MTKYNTLNVKLSNSRLKSRMKNDTEVTSKFSANVIYVSNGETNFPHKLFLSSVSSNVICGSNDETNFTRQLLLLLLLLLLLSLLFLLLLLLLLLLLSDTKVSRIHKSFANGSSANIKFLKTPLSNIVQLGELLTDLIE